MFYILYINVYFIIYLYNVNVLYIFIIYFEYYKYVVLCIIYLWSRPVSCQLLPSLLPVNSEKSALCTFSFELPMFLDLFLFLTEIRPYFAVWNHWIPSGAFVCLQWGRWRDLPLTQSLNSSQMPKLLIF